MASWTQTEEVKKLAKNFWLKYAVNGSKQNIVLKKLSVVTS